MKQEIEEDDAAIIFDAMQFTMSLPQLSETLRPLNPSTPTPNIGKMYALLPRVLPVANLGNIPSDLNLPIEGKCATTCIESWQEANNVDKATYSRSWNVTFESPSFYLWITTIGSGSRYFDADAVTFAPYTHTICGDCKGAHLVTCKHGVNILKSCFRRSRMMWKDVYNMIPKLYLPTCRRFDSLNCPGGFPAGEDRYIHMSAMQQTFALLPDPSAALVPVPPPVDLTAEAVDPSQHSPLPAVPPATASFPPVTTAPTIAAPLDLGWARPAHEPTATAIVAPTSSFPPPPGQELPDRQVSPSWLPTPVTPVPAAANFAAAAATPTHRLGLPLSSTSTLGLPTGPVFS